MNRSLSIASVAVAFAALTFGACAPHNGSSNNGTPPVADADSQALADDGSDTAAAENDSQSLTSTLVATSGSNLALATEPVGGDLKLDNIGDGAKLFFQPSGCLAVTSDTTAMTVTYVFTDCTSYARGLYHISGTINVSYDTKTPKTLTLTIKSTGLTINKATLDWDANAVITGTSVTGRSMHWKGSFTGVTRGGRQIERTNDKTVTWTLGDSCYTIEGTSTGNVTGRDLTTELISFSRCKAACPQAGSKIKVTRASGKFVELDYEVDSAGNPIATFTDAKGDDITFTPLCASL